jgi:hypothetical protein
MRFFSNDARESGEDQVTDERAGDRPHDDRPDRVQSDPVAVPHQRPPSPWSDTPGTADDTVAVDADRRDAVPDRDDAGQPPFHEPAPQPTAFGASTVGGAVAASAMANPQNDRWEATDRDSAADTGVGDDANVAAGDGVVTSRTDRTDADGVVDVPLDDDTSHRAGAVSAQAGEVTPTDADRNPDQDDAVTTDADRDRDHDAVVTDADRDRNQDDAVTTYDAPASPLKDDGGFDDPKAVDPATDQPLDGSADDESRTETQAAAVKDDDPVVEPDADDNRSADIAPPVVVPVAAAAAPATASAAPAETLFDRNDAQAFQERWRDVQLRFVDSPKDAAADAAKLVEEAVERLTAALRSQREGLHHDTDDTEQLRVQLRGYRDMLNRILGL